MRNKRILYYSLLVFVCLLAIYIVPYFFPYPEPIAYTMSYDYGFNNKIGMIFVGVSILIWMFLGLRSKFEGVIFVDNVAASSPPPSFILFYSSIFLYSVLMFIIIFIIGDKVYDVGESSYFLRHYYLLESGKSGYVDFAYGYGPLTLYPPYWLHKYTGLSIPVSFSVILYFYHIVGILCLHDIIRRLNLTEKEKSYFYTAIFFSILLQAAGGGIHYQLCRFVLPSWLILYICKMYNEYNEYDDKIEKTFFYRFFRVFIIPLSVCMVILMSPEIGIAFSSVCFLFLIFLLIFQKKFDYLLSLVLSLLVVWCTYLICPGLFSYFKGFSGGYANIPFTFNIILLYFLLSIFIIAYNLGALYRKKYNNVDNFVFVLISFSLLPACLGRCDPCHLLCNGLFIIPLSYIVIKSFCSVKLLNWILKFSFVIYLTPNFYLFKYYCIGMTLASIKNNIVFFSENKDLFPTYVGHVIDRVKYHISNEDNFLKELSSINTIALPFSYNYDLNMKVAKEGKMADYYYIGLSDKISVEDNIEKIESHKVPFLLLPKGWQNHKSKELRGKMYQSMVKELLFAWYPFEIKYDGYSVFDPMILYIMNHYNFEKKILYIGEYELWRRK